MASTVNWVTGVITVYRADMTLIQSNPTEIRQLDTNAFRIELRDLEDDVSGRPWPRTHDHNADVSVGGVQLADVLIILDPYTITFEDGQYAVYLQGTNNNILEKTNKNQVSVNPNNSAGLVTSSEIQYSVYNGGVTVDTINGVDSQVYPAGTPFNPIDNIANVELIRTAQRLPKRVFLNSDMTLGATPSLDDYIIVGQNHVETDVVIDAAADVNRVTIEQCNVSGTLDGNTVIRDSVVGTINYLNGHIHSCALSGNITLGGGEDAYIEGCAQHDMDIEPEIDMGGSGQDLVMPGYTGIIHIRNLTGANKIGIGLGPGGGQVVLHSDTVTAGFIQVSGTGELVDENGVNIPSGTWNGVTIVNGLLNVEHIAEHVWDESLTGTSHNVPTSAGRRLRDLSTSVITTGTAVSATANSITLNGDASSVDGAYDPALISIVGGTGYGQTRMVLQYDGATKKAWVDRNWKETPDATSEYSMVASAGREHINEGVAQGGTTNTITLNALGSPDNEAYTGQVVFIRSGTGEDQALRVIAYNGTTKVATMCENWAVIPDTTSVYVMLPSSVLKGDLLAEYIWEDPTAVAVETMVEELHKLQGLKAGSPMTVTPSLRSVEDIEQDITGDGETTTTVERRP